MNTVRELQEWYAAKCDGDWEHSYGVRIESLDNPGWLLRIDLTGTELEEVEFEPIVRDDGKGGWANMRIQEHTWQAACGPRDLDASISIFLEWIRHLR